MPTPKKSLVVVDYTSFIPTTSLFCWSTLIFWFRWWITSCFGDCCAVFRFFFLFFSSEWKPAREVACKKEVYKRVGVRRKRFLTSFRSQLLTCLSFVLALSPCPATGFVYLTGLPKRNELPSFLHTQGSFCLLQPSSFSRFLRRRFLLRQRKRRERGKKKRWRVYVHTGALLLLLLFFAMIYRIADQ